MAVSQSSAIVVAPTMLSEGRGGNSNKGRKAEEGKEEVVKTTSTEKDPLLDIWGTIQSLNQRDSTTYVHPLARRSKNSMSQQSLEICTENLGSETGSDGFPDLDDDYLSFSDTTDDYDLESGGEETSYNHESELAAVNYHCSTGRRSPVRSFPPPLPSISRRDGPCVQMRRCRRDGRLLVEAVPVPSQNYLHLRRENDRLVLSFIETTFEEIYPNRYDAQSVEEELHHEVEEDQQETQEEEEEEDGDEVVGGEDDGDEEVEVVDRGIVVEVKLLKGRRSSLVINKFVGSAPLSCQSDGKNLSVLEGDGDEKRRKTTGLELEGWGEKRIAGREQYYSSSSTYQHESKVLLTFKRLLMNRQALLHQVRRCSYQHGPLFIWEPCCPVAST